MTGIYMFTNKCNGKSYIGQSRNIEKRYDAHLFKKSEKSYFHDELHYYGLQNFDFQVLEECSVEDLNDREMYYINKFNTLSPNGYNLTAGGGNSPHLKLLKSFDDVKKIIELLKENVMTNEEIGMLFGISDQMVCEINNGRCWRQDDQNYPIRDARHKRVCIDGRYFDKRLYNQTACSCCGVTTTNASKTGLCRNCYDKKRAENIPSKEILEVELKCGSFESVAKKYDVTSTAVRKWCRKYKMPYHAKDYML